MALFCGEEALGDRRFRCSGTTLDDDDVSRAGEHSDNLVEHGDPERSVIGRRSDARATLGDARSDRNGRRHHSDSFPRNHRKPVLATLLPLESRLDDSDESFGIAELFTHGEFQDRIGEVFFCHVRFRAEGPLLFDDDDVYAERIDPS